MPRGPKYSEDEDADILATLSPTPVRMAALCKRTGRTPAALRKQYQRLIGSQAGARAARKAGAMRPDGADGDVLAKPPVFETGAGRQ